MSIQKKDKSTNPENIVLGQLLFSPEQAAAMLSIGVSTLYRLISAKKINCLKFGTRSVLHRDDLEAFTQKLESMEPGA